MSSSAGSTQAKNAETDAAAVKVLPRLLTDAAEGAGSGAMWGMSA
jgi:hypothetical protein